MILRERAGILPAPDHPQFILKIERFRGQNPVTRGIAPDLIQKAFLQKDSRHSMSRLLDVGRPLKCAQPVAWRLAKPAASLLLTRHWGSFAAAFAARFSRSAKGGQTGAERSMIAFRTSASMVVRWRPGARIGDGTTRRRDQASHRRRRTYPQRPRCVQVHR